MERKAMPKDSTPVEKLSQLAQEAQSFFEQVRSEPTNAWRLSEWTWGHLSREQQSIAERLGHDLRQQMALLVPAITMRLCWTSETWRGSLDSAEPWTRPF